MHHFHLDTDFGGDPDDFAALLMLLGMPEIQLTGITTVIDAIGQRAGYVQYVLDALGRSGIPVMAGTRVGLTRTERLDPMTAYWPAGIAPLPAPEPGASIEVIERSMWKRATMAVIGPYTNAAMFERVRAGLLRERRIVHMGGFITPPTDGFPPLTPSDDFNVQWDTRALIEMYSSFADITMVPMPVSLAASITSREVERIRACHGLGSLLADQLEAWSEERDWPRRGRENAALPDDLVGIMWDPLTCLVAAGWPGATIEPMKLMPMLEDGVITFEPHPEGRDVDVVTAIDTDAFRETFVAAIERALA